MSSGTSRSRSDRIRSRLTAFGRSVLIAAGAVFLAALASGANLLYLTAGMLWAVPAAAFAVGRSRLRPIGAEAALPESIFAGEPFSLALTVRNAGKRPAFQVWVLSSTAGRAFAVLRSGTSADLALTAVCPERGLVRLNDLWLESGFPFGLFRHRRSLAAPEATVFPKVREITGRPASPLVREDNVLRPVRGAGDDFAGVREYTEEEDARLIHWKLSAKTGAPVLKQYARETGSRITLTVSDAGGSDAEERISEAASLAKYFIDEGSEVRLSVPGKTIDYGRGILHLGLILRTLAALGRGGERRDARPGAVPFEAAAPSAPGRGGVFAAAATAAAFGALFLIEGIPALPLLLSAGVLGGGALAVLLRVRPVPRRILDGAAVLFLAYVLAVDLPRAGVVISVVHLVSFILVYLVMGPKGDRFFGQLLLAGFLAFLFASSQALSLAYFAFFAAYFVSAGAWILRRQDPEEEAPRRPAWGKALSGSMAWAAVLAVLAFALWPRPFNPGLRSLLARTGLLRLQASFRTFGGMTERVELGTWDSLRRNTAPALRVSFDGGDGGRPSFVRIRGAAFDLFDGRRWRRTRPEFRFLSAGRSVRARYSAGWFRRERGRLVSPGYEQSPEEKATSFFVYPVLNTTLVFSLGRVGAIEAAMPGAYFDANDTVYFSSAYPEGLRYRVLSAPGTPPFSGLIEDYESLLPRFLAVPTPDDAIRRLAAAVTRGRADPLRQAEAIEAHLQTAFTYSNSSGRGRQSLRDFLFESRAGNCEYFASAMCLLLRNLGIPSRLVVGFVSDDWNEYGGFFDVRQSDAHAWVEAYIQGRGWLTYDPTPSDALGSGPASFLGQLWSSAAGFFEALQFRWYRYVVGFDTFTQRDFWLGTAARIGRSLIPFLAALAVLAVVIIAGRALKRAGPGRWRGFRRARADGAYEDVLRRLSKSGLPRPAFQTGREYASRVASRFPALSPLKDLTELRYTRKFAGRVPSAEVEAGLSAAIKRELPAVRRRLRRERRSRAD